jgi:uracil-DNA glycosylase
MAGHPGVIDILLERSRVHDEWRPLLADALAGVDTDYLESLLRDDDWLPGTDRLLAAFRRDRAGVKFLLLGESPYPRRESANGIAFYDAAVGPLWSEQGLGKAVNRATSLRNIVKTAILAEGLATADADGKLTQQRIAAIDKSGLVQTLDELFANLQAAGFLLFNATPVLHAHRKPAVEARYWRHFLERLLDSLAAARGPAPTLVLWGKIAKLVEELPSSRHFPRLVCEHPYNVSFIGNPDMRRLFAGLRLLSTTPANQRLAASRFTSHRQRDRATFDNP